MSSAAAHPQSWGGWAIEVEEITGIRIHRDIVDEAVDAWEAGVLPEEFAERMLVEQGLDPGYAPFDETTPGDSGAVLSAMLLLAMGAVLGWALAPTLQGLFQ